VSNCTNEHLFLLFSWCTGFAALPVTEWKFQIKVTDDNRRCPSVNTCMTDDSSAQNAGVKMPTMYLPWYHSEAELTQKMEWALAAASGLNLY